MIHTSLLVSNLKMHLNAVTVCYKAIKNATYINYIWQFAISFVPVNPEFHRIAAE